MGDAKGTANAGYMTAHGPLPVTVPGAAKGWCDLHAKFGKLSLATVLAPAVRYAIQGFPVSEVIASEWGLPPNNSEMTSSGKYPTAIDGFMDTFTIDGKTPESGQLFRNPDLAETLRKIGLTDCQDFYNGSIAAVRWRVHVAPPLHTIRVAFAPSLAPLLLAPPSHHPRTVTFVPPPSRDGLLSLRVRTASFALRRCDVPFTFVASLTFPQKTNPRSPIGPVKLTLG